MLPVIQVRVAFTSDPFDAAPVWTDITHDVMSITTKRGRQTELARMEAGTATIKLKNFQGNYWPNNVAGDYFPDILPGKRVNIRATYNAVTYDIYTGFITGWPPSWLSKTGGQGSIVTIKSVDMIKNLSRYDLNTAGYVQELSGIRVGRVLDAAGWQTTHFEDDTTNTVTSTDASDLATLMVLLNEMKANYNTHLADTTVHINADVTNVVTSVNATTLATSIALAIEMKADFNNHLLVGITHHIDADTDNLWWTADPTVLAECILSANDGKASINGHLLAQQCTLDHGKTTLQATGAIADIKAMTHLFLLQDSELGIIYIAGNGDVQFEDRHHRLIVPYIVSQATFGDDVGENYYHDIEPEYNDEFIYNDIRITREGGAQQVAGDAASVTAYGTRTYGKTGLLITTDLIALDLANHRLRTYKEPALSARTLKILGERDPGRLWPMLCGFDISTRITLRLNQADIDEDYSIEGIKHNIDIQNQTWQTAWQLSNASADVFWLLEVAGFSELEETTYLGY